jgi:hypothetical protein
MTKEEQAYLIYAAINVLDGLKPWDYKDIGIPDYSEEIRDAYNSCPSFDYETILKKISETYHD